MTSSKRIAGKVNINFHAGAASMAKAGQALGPYGVNMVEVVRTYNDATAGQRGEVVPAVITVYEDRRFTLVLKTPPTSALLRAAAASPGAPPRPTAPRWPR